MISTDLEWHKAVGASSEAIGRLEHAAAVALPREYVELLRFSNGGEGPLPVSPLNLCLDSAEIAADYANSDVPSKIHPGLFVVGSSGGGDLIALDIRGSEPFPVVCFDGIDPEGSLEIVAASFGEFVLLIGSTVS